MEEVAAQLEQIGRRFDLLIDTNRGIAKTEHEIFSVLVGAIFVFGLLDFVMTVTLIIIAL